MTVNYTTNLSLGQPVTGTESGTWGDDVNNAVTSYLDIAIAGGLAITVTTTDVTLTITQGTSVATNIGSTTAQYAILNVSGAMTAARNLIVPSSSRIYLINNNTTGGFALTVKGSATTGVTLVNGEKAHVFWNGSDYAKVSNSQGGAGTFSSITNTGLTATRVVFSTSGGLETDSANLTFSGTILTSTGFAGPINGTVGATTPAAGAFTTLSATGVTTVQAGSAAAPAITTTGDTNTGIWFPAADTIAFTEGGAESMRIDSSGLLLIGTTSNTGGGRVDALSNATSVYTARSASSGAGTTVKAVRSVDSGASNFSNAQYDALSHAWILSNSTQAMTIDSSGNVGIGNTAPNVNDQVGGSRPLLVSKSDTVTTIAGSLAAIVIGNSDTTTSNTSQLSFAALTGASTTFFTSAAINCIFGARTNGQYPTGQLVFSTSTTLNTAPTEKMRIDSSGNVGIATSSPGYKLDVAASGARLGTGGTTNAQFIINGGSSGTAAGAVLSFQANGTGGLAIGNYSGIIGGTYDSTAYLYAGTGNALGFKAGGGTGYHAYMDSSGNVGIGTTSPQSSLQVSGAMPVSPTGNGIHMGITSSNTCMQFNAGSGNVSLIDFSISGTDTLGRLLYDNTSNFLAISTNSAEKMRIDSSGNVGIGTSSPSSYSKLAVLGSDGTGFTGITAINSNANVGIAGVQFSSDATYIKAAIGLLRSNSNGVGSLVFYNDSNTDAANWATTDEKMRIDANGNVGIGTTSPAVKLDVNGITGWSGNTTGQTAQIVGASSGITGGGNFRVLSSTTQAVDVGGALTLGGYFTSTTASVDFGAILGAKENSTGGNTAGYLAFGTRPNAGNMTERMRIDSSGNLMVGTTSAGGKLTVEQTGANANGANITNQTYNYQTLGLHNTATSGDNFLVSFITDASSFRGSITYNRAGGLVAYNTTSDYRAKDISGPVTGSGALIDSTPVYMGKMKDATQERPMFIAHEVPAYAHTGEKDAVDADGNPVYQQMDASALIPVMWAEIQSLRKRLTALEST